MGQEFPQKTSKALAQIVGETPLVLSAVRKGVFSYIKQNNLQYPNDRRIVNADAKLQAGFGQPEISVLQVASFLKPHLKFPMITSTGLEYAH